MLDMLGAFIVRELPVIIAGLFCCFAAIELLLAERGDRGGTTRGRMITNFGLPVLTAAFALILPLSSVGTAVFAERHAIGLFNMIAAPWWLILSAALLSRTFANYWLHRAYHAWPLLWRLHRVHHSDTHFDVTLGLREHPFSIVPSIIVFVAGTLLLGLPVWAVAIVDTVLIAANYWEHIDVRLPPRVVRMLGLIFVTPDMHRVHHSAWQPQTDSNFGACLNLWDRLFETYRAPQDNRVDRIGLGDADDVAAQHLASQLLLPLHRPPSSVRQATGMVPPAPGGSG